MSDAKMKKTLCFEQSAKVTESPTVRQGGRDSAGVSQKSDILKPPLYCFFF